MVYYPKQQRAGIMKESVIAGTGLTRSSAIMKGRAVKCGFRESMANMHRRWKRAGGVHCTEVKKDIKQEREEKLSWQAR